MNIKEALKITYSFTRTSKMPGLSYSLPAWECKTGWKLSKVEGTPCFFCYAKKGNYTRYPAIKAAQYKRLKAIDNPYWVEAMATVIKKQKVFRWHDAGDVQSKEHMQKIIDICKLTPNTKHWLLTQERQFLPDPKDVQKFNNKIKRIKNRWSSVQRAGITIEVTNNPKKRTCRRLIRGKVRLQKVLE